HGGEALTLSQRPSWGHDQLMVIGPAPAGICTIDNDGAHLQPLEVEVKAIQTLRRPGRDRRDSSQTIAARAVSALPAVVLDLVPPVSVEGEVRVPHARGAPHS